MQAHTLSLIMLVTLDTNIIYQALKSANELKVPPGNRLERLKGDRENQYSIRINQQYRICFTWEEGHADKIEITDYH